MKESGGVHIKDVLPESIAEELGIEKGDKLLTINGAAVRDILEYKFLTTDEFLELEIEKPDGENWIIELEKDYDDDIGIRFDGIIDEPRSCHNKCVFCFIDQLPKGMRKTLYFKDDDTRLSFLQGNFVTLTNLRESDMQKIIRYRISPINVSVHTTDPKLRVRMLNNKNAGKIMTYLEKLKGAGIEVKAQIVLCPGVNDGEQLEKTLKDLSSFYPELNCVAVVPVGLTRYRDNLYPLKGFDAKAAAETIDQITDLQKQFKEKLGTRFVFLSDEFHILSGRPFPEYEDYEGFPQLENGVGLITLLHEEVANSLSELKEQEADFQKPRHITIATGEYAAPFVEAEARKIKENIKNLTLEVAPIRNDFFGTDVKVSGLITGQDIIRQLKGRDIGSALLIPDSMLKSDENVFLDDATICDIEKALGVEVIICKEDGSDLVSSILSL